MNSFITEFWEGALESVKSKNRTKKQTLEAERREAFSQKKQTDIEDNRLWKHWAISKIPAKYFSVGDPSSWKIFSICSISLCPGRRGWWRSNSAMMQPQALRKKRQSNEQMISRGDDMVMRRTTCQHSCHKRRFPVKFQERGTCARHEKLIP